MIPRAATQYLTALQRLQGRAGLVAKQAWRSVDPDFISESWAEAVPDLSVAVSAGQVRAATLGSSYGADTLAAQRLYTPPDGWVNPNAFGGVSSRGAPLGSALYSVAPTVKSLIGGGHSVDSAMRIGSGMSQMLAKTQVADAGRAAAGLDTFVRKNVGYVRMVNPGACSRCVVLAGRFYRSNQGFLRHPNCSCVHVQTNVGAAEDEGLVADPYEYFESLSESEQDNIFTKSGAQAIRDGGDLFQVVNARRGMSYAGVSADGTRRGQRVVTRFTAEGTTKRGYFAGLHDTGFQKVAGSRYRRSAVQRLTPDAIYQRKLPRDQTLSLLRENGYLLSQGQIAEGAIRGMGSALTSEAGLTAAQQRLQTATLQWEAVQAGRNPFGKGPLTPKDAALAENNYRRWLLSGGEVFTR